MSDQSDDDQDATEAEEAEEAEEAKMQHPSFREQGTRVIGVSGVSLDEVDAGMVPGRWRRSRVDGYVWFEPALFDGDGENEVVS